MLKAHNVLNFKNYLNQNAELGWQEVKTTEFIARALKIDPIKKGFSGKKTGLLYKLGNGKNAILIRADIDALKTNRGIRHICGHSSNSAALMGAFLYSLDKVEKFNSNNKSIYFLFQPAEETYPSGAKAFIKECKDIIPQIKYAFAAHSKPLKPLNYIGLKKGALWARGDYMEVEIFGKMVHIKNTPIGIDALEAASHFILFIKSLQKRYQVKLRINIGVINGGLQANTVADYALLKGDIRLIYDKDQKLVKNLLDKKINEIEKIFKVKIKLHYFSGYPALHNNSALTKMIVNHIKRNSSFQVGLDESLFSFGCEDFSFIADKIPSIYALVGTGDKFDVHEEKCTISDKGTLKLFEYYMNIIHWWIAYKI